MNLKKGIRIISYINPSKQKRNYQNTIKENIFPKNTKRK
ncbi:MAG: hypothetical protein Sv326_1275 [Candidatus Fermentimicrarchaeum limneticum]|uniref:Uncharacterized protein n=1 Tax=Fermentimicrarchaeum limneticum TaxID=2795018 RepID=A0A7D5XKF5_FERL1|nr:MAG: hypothetical protein Sv326_1275 [Candidatus Fermentimicrarchaeum limneticum]